MKTLILIITTLFYSTSLVIAQNKTILISRDTVLVKDVNKLAGRSDNFVVVSVREDSIFNELLLDTIFTSKDGLLNGVYLEFYPNGDAVKVLGNYTGNIKSGTWYHWDVNGKLKKAEIWFAGKLKYVREYKTIMLKEYL